MTISPDEGKKIVEYTKEIYDTIADDFSHTREFLSQDLKGLGVYVEPGNTVVDLGCGNGRLYQLFEKKQVNYIGIDQSNNLIHIAKKKFPHAQFLVGEMTQTWLQGNIADVIYCIAAFHHLPTQEMRIAALKEMKRIVKHHGIIVMTNWNLYSDWAREKFTGDKHSDFYIPWKNAKGRTLGSRYYHGFLLEELHEIVEGSGLAITKQWYIKNGEEASMGDGENILTILESV